MSRPPTSSVTISKGRKGTTIRARGAAAQALFDLMTKPRRDPAPTPAQPRKAKNA